MAITITEKHIYNYISLLISDIKASIEEDANDNYITQIFGSNTVMGDYKITEEALSLFGENEDPFVFRFGYNLNPENLDKPIVMIIMPEENESNNSLGGIDSNSDGVYGSGFVEVKDKNFDTRFALMIVSQNMDLTILLYRIIQGMFVLYQDELELLGLNILKYSGN